MIRFQLPVKTARDLQHLLDAQMVVAWAVISDTLTPKRFRKRLLAMHDRNLAAFLDGARQLVFALRGLRHVPVEVEAELPGPEPMPPRAGGKAHR